MLTYNQKLQITALVSPLPVEIVYLFGSQSTGNANPESDYDFGVLFTPDTNSIIRFDLVTKLTADLSDILHQKTDVVDLEQSPIRFKYESIKPRQDIFVRRTGIRDDFEYRILRDYYDEIYFIKQATHDYLHTLAHG